MIQQSSALIAQVRVRLLVALSLLALGAGGQMVLGRQIESIRGKRAVDLRRPLAEFPERIGYWIGTDLPPDPKLIAKIKIDGYLQRVYVHPSGERVVLWMSYSRRSSDQYHYPTVCMSANGWNEDEAARQELPVQADAAGNLPVMRLLFNKEQRRQYVYYWYYLIGEDAIDRMMRHSSRAARAFLRGRRNASLTVEIFSQSMHPDRDLLDDFTRSTVTLLEGWMPEGSEAACDLGANY